MPLTDPTNTLAYHQSRVLTQKRDMSDVPLELVTKKIEPYLLTCGLAVPESEALWFYGMNHLVSVVSARFDPLEPLPTYERSILDRYHEGMVPRAVRAFYYLLLICTRESRHNKSLQKDLPKIESQFGAPVAAFLKSVNGGEAGIHAALLAKPPATTLGNYVECLRWQFYNSSWNGGYGGKAWGIVTDCLARFVNGEFTAEMMLDTVWTLCHNNGPIFNKSLTYSMYSPHLVRILDIQRSGQIPEAIRFDTTGSSFASGDLVNLMKTAHDKLGPFGTYVDWYQVEALGSVHKYPADKKKQLQTHGVSAYSASASAAEVAAALAAKKKAEADAAAHKKFLEENLEIMPGIFIPKITRATHEAA